MSHGIEFAAKNVADDAAAREELTARTGRMAVPVITIDDEVIIGFDRGRDCGARVGLTEATRSGDLIDWSAALAHRVSCPSCDEIVTLVDDVRPGDTIRCCGRTYRLTFEYGAFAAEDGEALCGDPRTSASRAPRARPRIRARYGRDIVRGAAPLTCVSRPARSSRGAATGSRCEQERARGQRQARLRAVVG